MLAKSVFSTIGPDNGLHLSFGKEFSKTLSFLWDEPIKGPDRYTNDGLASTENRVGVRRDTPRRDRSFWIEPLACSDRRQGIKPPESRLMNPLDCVLPDAPASFRLIVHFPPCPYRPALPRARAPKPHGQLCRWGQRGMARKEWSDVGKNCVGRTVRLRWNRNSIWPTYRRSVPTNCVSARRPAESDFDWFKR